MDRLHPGHPDYPDLLGAISSPPTLDVRGALTEDDALALAIVGARAATPYGIEVTERLAGELAARGVTIVSGLARGIDAAAHRGALGAGGRTVAVLPCGIDIVYPPEHRALARSIEARGALLSQFAPGVPALPGHFPARNRTLAGLSLGVVVVEASERSGALISAGFAADLGREVFAVPGRITSATSAGTNRLIQDGAKLITCWQDVVSELPEPWRRMVRASSPTTQDPARPDGESDEGRILAMLTPDEPQHIERLIARGGLEPARVAATLVALELGGWARQLTGQRWVSVGERARRT
ncbi:MAG: DNA protecting protein DprA [Candidatus Rokubacteria bacterium 13_2_20CM_2_70_11]|nr:MAG: DNA protecting protein DprA [Candidatus Rokubacteria bacterium 13_2_20CM_2_70_11]